MLVYRVCTEDEYKRIFEDYSFDEIGRLCSKKRYKAINNHDYKKHVRYLHFFSEFNDIFYLSLPKGNYICVYDIPDDILGNGIGIGKYVERFNFAKIYNVLEYAIESSKIDFDYLKQVYYIKEYIDVYDYLEEQSINVFVDNVYDILEKKEKEENVKKLSKSYTIIR